MLGIIILSALMSGGIAALLTWQLCRPGSLFHVLDHPNERSLHTQPTPRMGGIAIVAACVATGIFLIVYFNEDPQRLYWLGGAALLLAVTAYIDDLKGLTPGHRFVVQSIAAACLIAGGFLIDNLQFPGMSWSLSMFAASLMTLLFVVWMVNLYNFMDGMDGFAGGMAVVGFSAYAVFGLLADQWLFAGINLTIAGAALGFLFFNFPPARIFMGDTGSFCLGLFAAAFTIWGTQSAAFPLWIGVLVFSPFIVDATVTLVRRAIKGDKIWRPHKTHYYQRVVERGWGHRRTVLVEYMLMLSCSISALLALHAAAVVQWVVIGFWIAVYIFLAFAVSRLESKKRRKLTSN